MTMARVESDADGNLVLIDPDACAVIKAVDKHNCAGTLQRNSERVQHFIKRAKETNADPKEMVIVILNVDDANGKTMADVLMPDHDWKAYHNRGEVPFARGLAPRSLITEFLSFVDTAAYEQLQAVENAFAIVVVDYNTARVFVV